MAIYRDRPCPDCGGRGYISRCEITEFGGSAWSEKCQNCFNTGTVQMPITNSERLAELHTPGDQLKFIRGFSSNAKYAGDPLRLLMDESDEDLLEWLNKVSDDLDDYIFYNK